MALPPLTQLSLQRVTPGRLPVAYSNEERVRYFRAMQQQCIGNAYPWIFKNDKPNEAEEKGK